MSEATSGCQEKEGNPCLLAQQWRRGGGQASRKSRLVPCGCVWKYAFATCLTIPEVISLKNSSEGFAKRLCIIICCCPGISLFALCVSWQWYANMSLEDPGRSKTIGITETGPNVHNPAVFWSMEMGGLWPQVSDLCGITFWNALTIEMSISWVLGVMLRRSVLVLWWNVVVLYMGVQMCFVCCAGKDKVLVEDRMTWQWI